MAGEGDSAGTLRLLHGHEAHRKGTRGREVSPQDVPLQVGSDVCKKHFRSGEYYPYEGYYMINMFLHFIHRVINPVVSLRNWEDLVRFLDSERRSIQV